MTDLTAKISALKKRLKPRNKQQGSWHKMKSRTRKTSSKYKGVCYVKARKMFLASIRINDTGIKLGFFDLEIDAAKAYDSAAVELFGNFARLNSQIYPKDF